MEVGRLAQHQLQVGQPVRARGSCWRRAPDVRPSQYHQRMTVENQCTAVVDVIWERKRYPNQRCNQDANHINSTFAVDSEHVTYVPDRSAYWTDTQRTYNRKLGRYEIRG